VRVRLPRILAFALALPLFLPLSQHKKRSVHTPQMKAYCGCDMCPGAPELVWPLCSPALVRDLLLDIVACEDGLEVEPGHLALEPRVQRVAKQREEVLPRAPAPLELPDVRVATEVLHLDELVVEELDDILRAFQDTRPRVLKGEESGQERADARSE